MIVSWFSGGVSSAVATKIALERYPDMTILYQHIDDHHSDMMRFVNECEEWFGHKVEIQQSRYKTVDSVCRAHGFLVGPRGAKCTQILKRRERKAWEREHPGRHKYIWGFDAGIKEEGRAERRKERMPDYDHWFPLIEEGLEKKATHGIIENAKIKRCAMYDEGFPNNNCIGCLKGGAGYQNLVREVYPEVFESRSILERDIGHSIIKREDPDTGKIERIFLDELPEDMGRDQKIILPDCDMFCTMDYSYLVENPLV